MTIQGGWIPSGQVTVSCARACARVDRARCCTGCPPRPGPIAESLQGGVGVPWQRPDPASRGSVRIADEWTRRDRVSDAGQIAGTRLPPGAGRRSRARACARYEVVGVRDEAPDSRPRPDQHIRGGGGTVAPPLTRARERGGGVRDVGRAADTRHGDRCGGGERRLSTSVRDERAARRRGHSRLFCRATPAPVRMVRGRRVRLPVSRVPSGQRTRRLRDGAAVGLLDDVARLSPTPVPGRVDSELGKRDRDAGDTGGFPAPRGCRPRLPRR